MADERQTEKLKGKQLSKTVVDYEMKVQQANCELSNREEAGGGAVADADLFAWQREAEAGLYAKRKEAEGLVAMGEAQSAYFLEKPNRAASIHKRVVNDEREFTRSTAVVLNDDDGSMRDLEAAQSFLPASASKEQLVREMWTVSRASLFVGVSAGVHQPAAHQAAYYGVVAAILAAVPVEMATAFCLHRSNNPRFHSFAEGLQCVGIVLLIIACAVGGFELTLKA